MKAVPAYGTWRFDNKKALASVTRDLAGSADSRTKNLGSFAAHVWIVAVAPFKMRPGDWKVRLG